MNRTYNLVFNKALGLVQVVSELASCRGKKSTGKPSVSQAHTGYDENLSAPFKLKAISIASALTVGSFLIMASPSSYAQPIDNFFGNIPTLSPTGTITGSTGANGDNGYNGGNGGAGGIGINNSYGTIGTLDNNATINGGAGGAGGAGYGGNGGNGGNGGDGIGNYYGTIGTLNNNATINGGAGGADNRGSVGSGGAGISNFYSGIITTLNNNSNINGGAGGAGAGNGGNGGDGIVTLYGTINTLTNNGSITGGNGAAGFDGKSDGGGGGKGIYSLFGTFDTLTNNGSITGGDGGSAGAGAAYYSGAGGRGGDGIASFYGTFNTLTNNGSITGGNGGDEANGDLTYLGPGDGGAGVKNFLRATITTLNNNGSITGGDGGGRRVGGTSGGNGGSGVENAYVSTITTLNNNGIITGGAGAGADNDGFGISNFGSIVTLNNGQGGDRLTPAKTALTYQGNLPTNYNIIINSPSYYGQITFSSPSGTTTFGISSLSGTNIGITGTRYQNVISGLSSNDITNTATTLTYTNGRQVATYQLVADDLNVANTWDLLILSLISSGPSASDTQSSIHSLARKLRGAFSSQAVSTNFANMNYDCDLFDAKGVCVSVGGQQTFVDNPSSNRTSTVVVAGYKLSPNMRIGGFLNQNIDNKPVSGVNISNANPLMGAFAVWNQKEDRLGYQVKVSSAYQDKDVTTTRDVVDSSEAGTGKTSLNTQSYMGELSYAFHTNNEKTLVRPYAALRYTRIKQDGYTEQTSADVTAPLTYAALADRSTTALVGIKLNHKLAANVNLTGSIGVEQDLHHQVDNLTAAGVPDLISENFNNSIKRTRPVASIGAYYMPVKNQRISADVYYQQMAFQSTGSATAYVNYTIGF